MVFEEFIYIESRNRDYTMARLLVRYRDTVRMDMYVGWLVMKDTGTNERIVF